MIQAITASGMSYDWSFLTKIWWSIRSNAFRKSNRTTLQVALFPSVELYHECSILIRACVVLLPGTVPNCRVSIFASTAGLTYCSTTNSSATFDRMGVNEIGRRCLLTSVTGFCLGMGAMFASFHDCGSRASLNEPLRMFVTTGASRSAFSFKSQLCIPSGPVAFVGFSASSF